MAKASLYGFRAARLLAAALWVVLIAAFAEEFVFLNNSAFILYAFLLFVALGALIGVRRQYIGGVLMASMAFIAVSSILYVAKAVLMQFVWLNLAIIGYYLLVSLLIGLSISMFAESNGWTHRLARLERFLSTILSRKVVAYAAISAALLLMAAPVWPASLTVPQSQYVNVTEYVAYHGNATNASSYTLIASPPPYNYTVGLCANGTDASARVSVQRKDGTSYAFLFSNLSAMRSAASSAAGYPFARQLGIYRAHAEQSLYDGNSSIAAASVRLPDFGCAYMVLLYSNLSTIRIGYNISYYGLIHKYESVRVPGPSSVLVVNRTSGIVNGMGFLMRNYANAAALAESNGTESAS